MVFGYWRRKANRLSTKLDLPPNLIKIRTTYTAVDDRISGLELRLLGGQEQNSNPQPLDQKIGVRIPVPE
jgi:hypothetical protein